MGSKAYDKLTVYLYEYVGYYEQGAGGLAAECHYCGLDFGSIEDWCWDCLHMLLRSVLVERAQIGLIR